MGVFLHTVVEGSTDQLEVLTAIPYHKSTIINQTLCARDYTRGLSMPSIPMRSASTAFSASTGNGCSIRWCDSESSPIAVFSLPDLPSNGYILCFQPVIIIGSQGEDIKIYGMGEAFFHSTYSAYCKVALLCVILSASWFRCNQFHPTHETITLYSSSQDRFIFAHDRA
jgi:hypothetical protein